MINDTRKIEKKFRRIRLQLLTVNGFFALLLCGIKIKLVDSISDDKNIVIETDGDTISISKYAALNYSDRELRILIMHELMHIALKHTYRTRKRNKEIFNKAADIVVNSNLMYALGEDKGLYIKGKKLEHTLSDGKEGYLFSTDEVYSVLMKEKDKYKRVLGTSNGTVPNAKNTDEKEGDTLIDLKTLGLTRNNPADNHDKWQKKKTKKDNDKLNQKICQAAYSNDTNKDAANVPMAIERMLKELNEPKVNWRELLHSYIQNEIIDYSFNPPDRRMQDSEFILPDFNEPDVKVDKILFMVDTSGSMSEEQITDCFSEIQGAINQFDSHLRGQIGFFDTEIKAIYDFDQYTDLSEILPTGGGGTDFNCIFYYLNRLFKDEDRPKTVVILTDGYAPEIIVHPRYEFQLLWLINNNVSTPRHGEIIRIE
ncbi:MAG: VWA-like domain-containing protein [Bacilli bacterium]|nr:VWA-like domain-containing protein [Bacilli bacterium]